MCSLIKQPLTAKADDYSKICVIYGKMNDVNFKGKQ